MYPTTIRGRVDRTITAYYYVLDEGDPPIKVGQALTLRLVGGDPDDRFRARITDIPKVVPRYIQLESISE